MAQWVYFIHPRRDDFAATMTKEEQDVWELHFRYLQGLLADGVLILAGPTLGRINTGIGIFEAPDLAAAQAIVDGDPVSQSGFADIELREMRAALLRGAPAATVGA